MENAWSVSVERLISCRKSKGFTQEHLGELMGVHVNTIRKWEEGKACPISRRLGRLAAVLGTTVAYLSGETDSALQGGTVGMSSEFDLPETLVPSISNDNKPVHVGLPEYGKALIYENHGERVVLPPTTKGYDLLEKVIRMNHNTKEAVEILTEEVKK